MMRPGATPKLTASARESIWTPNSDWVCVSRATRPSMPSKSMEKKTAIAAAEKSPFMAAMMP